MIPRAILLLLCLAVAPCPGRAADEAEPAVIPPDLPCRITKGDNPQFPVRMLKDGITHGSARILLHVDEHGALLDSLVTAYTKESFAAEALRVIGDWEFAPARIKGEPMATILDLTFNYELNATLLVQRYSQADVPSAESIETYDYRARRINQLDSMPTPLSLTQPTYPAEWERDGIAGKVTIDFFIDETGRTRFAAAAPGGHELLDGIAVAAVQQWRFTPPLEHGRPVLVHARQVFSFGTQGTQARVP